MGKLTLTKMKTLRGRKGKRNEWPDGDGLYVRFNDHRPDTWAIRYRLNGVTKSLVIGIVAYEKQEGEPIQGGLLDLPGARQLALRLMRGARQGHDPARQAERQRVPLVAEDNTIGRHLVDYVSYRKGRIKSHVEEARIFGLRVDPSTDAVASEVIAGSMADVWGHVQIDKLQRPDVRTFLKATEKRAPTMPARQHAALSVFFDWAMRNDLVTVDPTRGIDLPPARAGRSRVLDDTEICNVELTCDTLPKLYGVPPQLMLALAARRSEISGMRWSEFSDDLSSWTLPAERSKSGRPLTLPLPIRVRELIKSVESPKGQGGYVFSATGRLPFKDFARLKRTLDERLPNMAPWRLHDARRKRTHVELPKSVLRDRGDGPGQEGGLLPAVGNTRCGLRRRVEGSGRCGSATAASGARIERATHRSIGQAGALLRRN